MEEAGWDVGLPICAPRRDETDAPSLPKAGAADGLGAAFPASGMRLCMHRWNYVTMKMKL